MRTKEGRFLGDLLRLCAKHGVCELGSLGISGPEIRLEDVSVVDDRAAGYTKAGRRVVVRRRAKPAASAPPAPPSGYVQEAGVVRSASISDDDHDAISLWVYVDMAVGTQGFGGYYLGPKGGTMTEPGAGLVEKIRVLFGLDPNEKFEALKGRRCYALYKAPYRWNDLIRGLQLPAAEGGRYVLIEDWAREFGLDR